MPPVSPTTSVFMADVLLPLVEAELPTPLRCNRRPLALASSRGRTCVALSSCRSIDTRALEWDVESTPLRPKGKPKGERRAVPMNPRFIDALPFQKDRSGKERVDPRDRMEGTANGGNVGLWTRPRARPRPSRRRTFIKVPRHTIRPPDLDGRARNARTEREPVHEGNMQSVRRWKRGQAHRCTCMLGDGEKRASHQGGWEVYGHKKVVRRRFGRERWARHEQSIAS